MTDKPIAIIVNTSPQQTKVDDSTVIHANTKWRHKKTKRPIVVTHGNYIRPEVVAGRLMTGQGSKVTYKYTDRKTRVMPCEATVETFLKKFEKTK